MIEIKSYDKLKQFLIYKGKKSKTENIFRQFLISRAKKNKISLASNLKRCKYNTRVIFRLNELRRGKRIRYKVHLLEPKLRWSTKNFFCAFGTHIRNQNPKNFEITLEKEIETFSTDKNHPIRLNIDKLYILAKQYNRYGFFRKKKVYKLKKNKVV